MKLKNEPKTCKRCGAKFIQTGKGNQVYCPDCRAGKKLNAAYIKARLPGEVKVITPEENATQELKVDPEVLRALHTETPEPELWYKARITKGKELMLEAKIHPEMLALILKETR